MLFISAIAMTPLVDFIGVKPTIISAAVAGPLPGSDAPLHHATGRDPESG
jgi:hypothetical protein